MDHDQPPRPPVAQPQAMVEGAAPQPEVPRVVASGSGDSHAVAAHDSQSSGIDQPLLKIAAEGHPMSPRSQENPFEGLPPPPPARSRDGHTRVPSRYRHWAQSVVHPRNTSAADFMIPVDDKSTKRRTLGERLDPTIKNAEDERIKYATRAMWTGYTLNIAIGLQVLLGALTTGLAAAVKDARQAQVSTAILGGLSTLVASYLARARGSGEPEVSNMRVKDLDHFLRDCRAFRIDHAHEYANPGEPLDHRVEELRRRLEELLGNATNVKNSLAPTQMQPVP